MFMFGSVYGLVSNFNQKAVALTLYHDTIQERPNALVIPQIFYFRGCLYSLGSVWVLELLFPPFLHPLNLPFLGE